MGLTLGQLVRVSAEAMTAYDEQWFRMPPVNDDDGAWIHESCPTDWSERGWQCVHTPIGRDGQPVKRLWHRPLLSGPREGVIVARTHRATGHWKAGYISREEGDCTPNHLSIDKVFTLYEVSLSLGPKDRVFALVDDIEEAAS